MPNYKNNKKKNQVFTLLEDRLFRASALVLLTCLICVPKKERISQDMHRHQLLCSVGKKYIGK